METPFTAEQFSETFRIYNQAVWPMQIVLYLLSFTAVYFAFKPTIKSGKMISGLLAFFWLWMGVVYHLIYFTTINKAAYLFGAVFIFQAMLFLAFGVFQNKLSFAFRSDGYGITGIILIVFALIIYPVLGYSFGHGYPYSPTFGLPCPTTIFTFGLLLLCEKRCPLGILVIPFVWSIIGFTAAFNFGIVEDTGLLVSGVLTFIMVIVRNKKLVKNQAL